MEGGLTRKYGYVALVALLVAVLLVLLFVPETPYEKSRSESAAVDSALLRQVDGVDNRSCRSDRTPYRNKYSRPVRPSSANSAEKVRRDGRVYKSHDLAPIGINTSDSLTLQRLRGIGPVLSSRIVRYRESLGGFVSKEQLREVYGLTDSTYDGIAPHLVEDSVPVRQIDINTATIAQLRRHPYLDYYQAKAIVQLREQQGPYSSVEDVQRVPLIEPETYNKIRPYLTCNSPQKK